MKTQLKFTRNMLNSLQGIIPGGISVQDFSEITKNNAEESQKILETFFKLDIGSKLEDKYYFESGDKLKTAIMFIEKGLPLDEIAIALDWRDFEGLTAEILAAKNFAIIKKWCWDSRKIRFRSGRPIPYPRPP